MRRRTCPQNARCISSAQAARKLRPSIAQAALSARITSTQAAREHHPSTTHGHLYIFAQAV
eukprot:9430066-Lingulodinium_polyedra.AAC.1